MHDGRLAFLPRDLWMPVHACSFWVVLKKTLVFFTFETAIHEMGRPYGMLYEDSHWYFIKGLNVCGFDSLSSSAQSLKVIDELNKSLCRDFSACWLTKNVLKNLILIKHYSFSLDFNSPFSPWHFVSNWFIQL